MRTQMFSQSIEQKNLSNEITQISKSEIRERNWSLITLHIFWFLFHLQITKTIYETLINTTPLFFIKECFFYIISLQNGSPSSNQK